VVLIPGKEPLIFDQVGDHVVDFLKIWRSTGGYTGAAAVDVSTSLRHVVVAIAKLR
jgi:hypothetical protein